MNLLLWGTQIDESLFPILDLIRAIGFEGVEVPIFDTNPKAWHSWRKKLDELGLHRECDTFCGPTENLISADASIRANGLAHLKKVIDCGAVLGATKLMGPYHSALGIFTGQAATSDEWKWGWRVFNNWLITPKNKGFCSVWSISIVLNYTSQAVAMN
ncbi:MAG: TIM barrel protein [Spirosomataceae bacterium]